MSLIEVRQLHKEYPIKGSRTRIHAVNGVDLQVDRGEALGIVGESGSGKSTIARCLVRLIEPTSGEIVFGGRNIERLSQGQLRPLRFRFQMVFQDPYTSLDPRMRVGQILSEPLGLLKLPRSEQPAMVAELLRMVRLLPTYISRYPHQLSGGEQQRVGIARAIATRPDLLVLDEPTASLDISVRSEILSLLKELGERLNLAYVFISHDLHSVRGFCGRVQVIYSGIVVEEGDTQNVFRAPSHPYTRALIAAVLPRHKRQGRSAFILQGEPAAASQPREGCPVQTRCPFVIDRCRVEMPRLEARPDGRLVACFNPLGELGGTNGREGLAASQALHGSEEEGRSV